MGKNGKKIEKEIGSLVNIVIGIDPGKGGGIAIIESNENGSGTKLFTAYNCPETIEEMAILIGTLKSKSEYINCFLEKVHAFPTDGRSSAFKFGMNYGIWRGILCSFGIRAELVTPQAWQKTFGILHRIKQERKRKLKEIATEGSNIKATLKTADAICIAIYGHALLEAEIK